MEEDQLEGWNLVNDSKEGPREGWEDAGPEAALGGRTECQGGQHVA